MKKEIIISYFKHLFIILCLIFIGAEISMLTLVGELGGSVLMLFGTMSCYLSPLLVAGYITKLEHKNR